MERKKAELLLARIAAELAETKFNVLISAQDSEFGFIEDGKCLVVKLVLDLACLNDQRIYVEDAYPVVVTKAIMVSPEMFGEPDADTKDAFWRQFLEFIPREGTTSMEDPSAIVDWCAEDRGCDEFIAFYWNLEVALRVILGGMIYDNVGMSRFCDLIIEEKFRAIWEECVGSLPLP